MLFVGLRQDLSLLHYWSRRKLHPVTAIGTTHEWSPLFFGEPGSGYLLGPWSRGHAVPFWHHDVGRFRARGLGRDDRLFHRHRFVTDFRFFHFAYPYDWYPDYDYGYPHDYSYYDYSPVFGNGYSSNLVMLVQS